MSRETDQRQPDRIPGFGASKHSRNAAGSVDATKTAHFRFVLLVTYRGPTVRGWYIIRWRGVGLSTQRGPQGLEMVHSVSAGLISL